MSDYDQRQYSMMLRLLKAFDTRSVGLGKLIVDLEALLGCLQDTEKAWKNSFYRQWGMLEDVYADALDKGLEQLPPDSENLIEDDIQNLRRLVQERIDTTPGAATGTESGDATGG